ncbi:MAG: methionine adenosyltransferase domain-containing protein [Eubacteriales bacterium]|nr:methionine adenosyltransferase domain-containing protein [Eubacteriales bacterium]
MYYYSNEIVWRGHPDKVCDQISAAILKECMKQDKNTRAGIETMGGKGKVFITGEVTTNAVLDVKKIALDVLEDVGYGRDFEIIDNIGKQSADIALGTNDSVGGAGDQGMMFGYACDDTERMLPKAMVMLQELAEWYDEIRKEDSRFLPDGKSQITGIYEEGLKLTGIRDWTISYQNTEVEREETDRIIIDKATEIAKKHGVEVENFLVNPTGKFLIGGFEGDAGLTGRKIVVDAYQSFANVGGGCMNGKDPTKVDFSAAHKARELAKRLLPGHHYVEVQLSYAIGKAEPLAIYIDSDKGEIKATPEMYAECTPARIIEDLKLKEIDYTELAKFGHFR